MICEASFKNAPILLRVEHGDLPCMMARYVKQEANRPLDAES